MKTTLKIEELGMFILAIYLFSLLDFSWWIFPALILLPDLSMIGYLANPRIGALFYNIGHHKALAIFIYILGSFYGLPYVQLAGVILFGHSSMDRMLGYGLKYPDDFKNTHLGKIGKDN